MKFKNAIERIKLTFLPTADNGYRPKFLESRCLMFCLVILFVLKLATLPFLVYFPKSVFFGAIVKSALVELSNKERKALGLRPLVVNPVLEQAAFLKARDIFEKNYFSHYSPQGVGPWHWFKIAGYNYKNAGENLAIGFLDSQEAHRAWMNSPSHRANILNPDYKDIGIAVLKGNFQGRETTVVVQFFGLRQQNVSAPKVITKSKIMPSPSPIMIARKTEKKAVSPEPQVIGESKVFGELSSLESPLSTKTPVLIATETPILTPITESSGKIFLFSKGALEKTAFHFFSFLALDYSLALQILNYSFLALIILVLIINIFVKINIQHWDLILKTLGFIIVLIFFILLDSQGAIINLIPHDFQINIID